MTALVEVHTEEEADRALEAGRQGHRRQRPRPARPSRSTGRCFAPHRAGPAQRRACGSPSPASAARATCSPTPAAGADAVLVGEGLVTSGDPRSAVADLVTAGIAPVVPETVALTSGRSRRPGAAAFERGRRRSSPPATIPTSRGHFGVYGGRFVPEALIAALDELTAAYEKARGDDEFLDELDRLQRDYSGRPVAAVRRDAARGARRRRADPAQARRPQPHRLAQDQQRARPGAAGQADGQDAGDRRDRRRPARRRDRDGVRAARPGVRRLHGRGRHRAAGAQRRADAAARRRGGPGRRRLARRSRTRSTRRSATGSPTSTTPTTCFGTAAGPHPFPTMVRDFQRVIGAGGARADAGAGRAGCPTRWRPASAAAPTRSASSTRSSTTRRAAGRLRGRRRRRRDRAARRDAHRRARRVRCTARARTCCRTRTARPSSRTRSQPAWTTRASARSTRCLKDIGRAEYRPVTDAEAMDAFALLCRTEGIIPAIEIRARRGGRAGAGPRARARTRSSW